MEPPTEVKNVHIEWSPFVALINEGTISDPTFMPESDEPGGRRRWALVGYDRHRQILYTLITARKEIRFWSDLGTGVASLFEGCGQEPSVSVVRSPNTLYVHSDGKRKITKRK